MLTRSTDVAGLRLIYLKVGGNSRCRAILIGAVCVALLVMSLPLVALAQPIDSVIPPDSGYPDGVSPSHVYAKIDLLDRSLDRLIEARNVTVPSYPRQIESELQPMHVYQTVLKCAGRLQELDDQLGVAAVPTLALKPRVYDPRDVYFIVNLMLDNVRRIAEHEGITDLPGEETPASGKEPTDVYNRAVTVFVKLSALVGYADLSPSEVFAEMVRGAEDVRSMLRQADPASRYRIDIPPTEPDRKPGHVFAKCLEIRTKINTLRLAFNLKPVPVPEAPPLDQIRPHDVFFQTQIMIAELNLLKKPLDTVSSTPLPIPVTGKTPTDVHEKATMILYLLEQVKAK